MHAEEGRILQGGSESRAWIWESISAPDSWRQSAGYPPLEIVWSPPFGTSRFRNTTTMTTSVPSRPKTRETPSYDSAEVVGDQKFAFAPTPPSRLTLSRAWEIDPGAALYARRPCFGSQVTIHQKAPRCSRRRGTLESSPFYHTGSPQVPGVKGGDINVVIPDVEGTSVIKNHGIFCFEKSYTKRPLVVPMNG